MSLITVDEAAALARVSKQTVLRAAARGEFQAIRAGARVVRIDRESYLEFLYGVDWRRVVGEED